MRHRRPPRLETFNYRGKHSYFVTCGTDARQKLFDNPTTVSLLTDQIVHTCEQRDFELIAYVFMEDHVHFLVRGKTEDAHFISMMTVLRQRTAMAYRRGRGQILWQDGYFDRVLRPTDDVFAIVEYIRDNPSKAGLPPERGRYPYVWCASTVSPATPGARGFSRVSEDTDRPSSEPRR